MCWRQQIYGNHGRNALFVVVFVVFTIGTGTFLYFGLDREHIPDETAAASESLTVSPPEEPSVNTPTSFSSKPLPTEEPLVDEGGELKSIENQSDWTVVVVEHCQMSIAHPAGWRQGTNEHGVTYLSNFSAHSEPPPHGVTIELCPTQEGSFDANGERFEFPGGVTGNIFRGGLHGAGDLEREIALLYQGNGVVWFLDAKFEKPATNENPATAEFFSIINTIEYYDSGLHAHEPSEEPETTIETHGIDPQFITYACHDRLDPDYEMALEQWGYLTWLGRTVICVEFTNGNHEFVINQQQLLSTKIHEQVFHDYEHMKQLHESDPEAFYLHAAAAGGIDPRSPSGSFLIDTSSYSETDVLLLAKTEDGQLPTIDRLHKMIRDWAQSDSNTPSEYATAGQVLSPTLTRQSNHLFRLLDGVRDNESQAEIIYVVLHALHHPSRRRWNLFEGRYNEAYQQFRITTGEDLWFHEWLLQNPETFLGHFWPNENWSIDHDG